MCQANASGRGPVKRTLYRAALLGCAWLLGNPAVRAQSPATAAASAVENQAPTSTPTPAAPAQPPATPTVPAEKAAAPVTPTTAPGAARSTVRRTTLAECLKLALQRYPSVAEAKARVAQAQAQLRQARTAPFSEFETTAGLAMAPTVRGTQTFSPDTDVSLSENMGLAWQVNLNGTIPLWTFGKIASLSDAAQAGVQVKQYEARKVQNELRLSVRQAYFGVLFARDALSLLLEATGRIDKQLSRMEAQLAAEEDEADEVPLFKLKMYRAELAARESEIRRQEAIALSGLRLLTGEKGALEVVDEPMPEPQHRLGPLTRYLTAARLHRPEVNMARAGVLAREAQLRLEHARIFPDIGLTLNAGWSQAPEVTDQLNPFVRDPGNYLRYGAAIGLRWKLDVLPQAARYDEAKAKLEEMRATEQFALGGVGVEVEKAYREAEDAERRLRAYAESAEWARRWMIAVQQGIDIGTYDDEELVTPAKEYALRRFSEMNAAFDYNVALGRLALATGWDAVAVAQDAVAVAQDE